MSKFPKANALRSVPKALLIGATALGLAGCVSVLPEPNAANALFEVSVADTAPHSLSNDIVVRQPEAVRVFAGQSIVAANDAGGLLLVPGVEWAGPSTQIMQLALINALNGGDGEGIAVSPAAGTRGDYEIEWRIRDLALRGDSAVCELEAIVLEGTTRSPVDRIVVRRSADISSAQADIRAKTLSETAASAVSELATAIAEGLPAN